LRARPAGDLPFAAVGMQQFEERYREGKDIEEIVRHKHGRSPTFCIEELGVRSHAVWSAGPAETVKKDLESRLKRVYPEGGSKKRVWRVLTSLGPTRSAGDFLSRVVGPFPVLDSPFPPLFWKHFDVIPRPIKSQWFYCHNSLIVKLLIDRDHYLLLTEICPAP